MSDKKSILMICLGNICRSPIAEAVMIDVVKKQNVSDKFEIDSAAIGNFLFFLFNQCHKMCKLFFRILAYW